MNEEFPMKTEAATTHGQAPDGWWIAGSYPADYEVSIDKTIAHSGQASGSIKSRRDRPRGFGTLMQMCKADPYRGQHVRMSAYVKAQDVSNWAGLWMRVDGVAGKVISFDNMQGRPIQGTADWNRYEIVLDVPAESLHLAFGVLLTGKGQVWIDDVQFETVGPDVPLTGRSQPEYSLQPVNLGFEE
jgi:hypothetical protein